MLRSAISYLVITACGLFLTWLVAEKVGTFIREAFSELTNVL